MKTAAKKKAAAPPPPPEEEEFQFPCEEFGKRMNSRFCQAAYDYAVTAANDYSSKDPEKREALGGVFTGRYMRLAARRFLSDLERAKADDSPFYFWPPDAHRFCRFIELFPHVEGKWKTRTLELCPADCFLIVQIFGFRMYSTHERRFTRVLYAVARKNGKSTKAAAILNAAFCLEKELGAQAICAATTGSQARIVWNIVKKQLQKSPSMRDRYSIKCRANDIQRDDDQGGFIKPINAKASTQDGLNPAYITLDELHAHQDSNLINVLQSAAGARSCPLWLITTTEGYENPGPWSEERNFAEQVLEGVIEADHYLAIVYRIDDEDDDFDESKWIKANPLMEVNPLILKENRKLAIEARAMPGRQSEFRIKRLNRRSSTANGWVNLDKWRRCEGEVNLKEMRKYKCWAALDLAFVTDMNAWRLMWEIEPGVKYATWGRFWVPEVMVKLRSERKTIPYESWVRQGYIIETKGEVADYNVIREDILEDYEQFSPELIAYDPWNATQLASQLDDKGLPIVQFIQGTKSYNPAMKAFERLYLSGSIVHDGNKVLTWNMSNLTKREDTNKNMAPDRKKSKDKIDGACTLLMCCGLMEAQESGYVSGAVVAA